MLTSQRKRLPNQQVVLQPNKISYLYASIEWYIAANQTLQILKLPCGQLNVVEMVVFGPSQPIKAPQHLPLGAQKGLRAINRAPNPLSYSYSVSLLIF
jgi:hypothetical protein